MVSKNFKDRGGIGLYSYEQTKYITPFQYLAQVVVGAFIFSMGVVLLCHLLINRIEEIKTYGAAENHFWGWLGGGATLVIGVFMAHAGVIFYCRRIARTVAEARRSRRSRSSAKH